MKQPFWKKRKLRATKSKVWRICQRKPLPPETFTAYYIAAWERSLATGMNLHYSGELGDDDFPKICTEILLTLLDRYQTFFCTDEDMTHGYRFQNGWESGENECFPEACLRYAAEQNKPIHLLTDGKNKGIFPAKGLSEELLTAYLSNPWNELRTAPFELFAYQTEQTVESEFHTQKAKLDDRTCDIFVMYTELPNQLEIVFNKVFPPLREVLERIQAVCEFHGKKVTVVWNPEKLLNLRMLRCRGIGYGNQRGLEGCRSKAWKKDVIHCGKHWRLLAPVAIPVLSLVGGVGGSFAGDALAQGVVDITNVED